MTVSSTSTKQATGSARIVELTAEDFMVRPPAADATGPLPEMATPPAPAPAAAQEAAPAAPPPPTAETTAPASTEAVSENTAQAPAAAQEAAPPATPPPPPPAPSNGKYLTYLDFPRKSDRVIIVGFAGSRDHVPFDDKGAEVWGLNELWQPGIWPEAMRATLRWDRWFEIHDVLEREPPSPRTDQHLPWLRACGIPIYMQRRAEPIPWSVELPIDELLERFHVGDTRSGMEPRKRRNSYFTNQVSFMIALAIFMEYREIWVYGVDMAQQTEYAHQRPSCEYYLGWAAGAGIKLRIPNDSDLLKATHLYGYESDNAMLDKMLRRQKELQGRLQYLRGQCNQRLADIHKHKGACEYLIYLEQKKLLIDPQAIAAIKPDWEATKARLQQFEAEFAAVEIELHQIEGGLQDCNYMIAAWGG